MKKIAADRNYRMLIKKAEEKKGYRLVESETYEQDYILGYYETRESAVRGGYNWVVSENKKAIERLDAEADNRGRSISLSQKKKYYDPWKVTDIDIEGGIFQASNSMRDIAIEEYSYSTDTADSGAIDLSENDEYVNHFNDLTSKDPGEQYPSREGMRRPISNAVDGET